MEANILFEAEVDDSELVDAAQSGDREAFSEIVRKYETKVRAYCYHMLRDRTASEDAAQDIFLKIFKSLKTFKSESSFSTWIYRICVNHCIDLARKRNFRNWFIRDSDRERSYEEIVPTSMGSAEYTAPVESKMMLFRIMEALSPDYRSIIILREVQGLSYSELAEALNCNIESVKSRLKRARKKLVEIRKVLES